jgi:hypothetical protein
MTRLSTKWQQLLMGDINAGKGELHILTQPVVVLCFVMKPDRAVAVNFAVSATVTICCSSVACREGGKWNGGK